MDVQEFIDNIPSLSDLKLAVLLSLIAKQHCLVSTEDDLVDALASELALIVSETFKLTYVILESSDLQSAERFGEAILDDHHTFANEADFDNDSDAASGLHSRLQAVNFKKGSVSVAEPKLDNRLVVNVVIAKDFNTACHDVQIQALELIRRSRIFSRTTVHPAPKTFLFLPLISTAAQDIHLNHHLIDRIFMSHHHSLEHGFSALEQMDSVSGAEMTQSGTAEHRLVVKQELIDQLRELGQAVAISAEMRRYLQDVSVFMRLERGVDGGVTAYSNVCFVELAKYLAPLHGIDFITPALIGLAAKKVFPHRLVVATPLRDRSLQYGSTVEGVRELVEGVRPEDIIEIVLGRVDCPL